MPKLGLFLKKSFVYNVRCTGCTKKCSNLFLLELRQISTKCDNFQHTDSQNDNIMQDKYTQCTPHVIYINALTCKTQMLQLVTLRGDYQYHIAQFFIIDLTESVM